MKKIILIFACAGLLIPCANAQQTNDGEFKVRDQTTKGGKSKSDDDDEKAFREGKFDFTVGYGFPDMYKSFIKSIANSAGTNFEVKGLGPAFFKAEYGVTKLIGLGAAIGYQSISVTDTYSYQESNYNSTTGMYEYHTYEDVEKLTFTSLSVAARINFHFGTGKRLDPYAGVGVGYSQKQYKFTYTTNNPSGLSYTPQTYSGFFPFYFGITAGLRYYFTPNIGIYGEVGFDKWSLIQGGLAVKI
jgi:opacity protein-like surface antigen